MTQKQKRENDKNGPIRHNNIDTLTTDIDKTQPHEIMTRRTLNEYDISADE